MIRVAADGTTVAEVVARMVDSQTQIYPWITKTLNKVKIFRIGFNPDCSTTFTDGSTGGCCSGYHLCNPATESCCGNY